MPGYRVIVMVVVLALAAACSDAGGLQPILPSSDVGNAPSAVGEEGPAPSTAPSAAPTEVEGAYAGGFTKAQRQSDAAMIVGILERGYAPRAWKEEFYGLSFEEVSQQFSARAGEAMGDAEFYVEIARYLSAFKDTHVSFQFPSTAIAWLPFSLVEFGGVFYVEAADDAGDEGAPALQAGDEIESICGQKPGELRDELKRFIGYGNGKTEDVAATRDITVRMQQRGHAIPRGPCRVVARSGSSGERRELDLSWTVAGSELAELNDPGVDLGKGMRVRADEGREEPNPLERLRTKEAHAAAFGPRVALGEPESFFPVGPAFVERKKGPYPSGMMEIGGRPVGFLRIHSYSGGALDLEEAKAELEEEIAFFEEHADALIIDQTANPGGDWCYTLELASFFFDAPFVETPDLVRANRSWLLAFESMASDEALPEKDRAIALEVVAGMREALRRGDLLTAPVSVCNLGGKVAPYAAADGRRVHFSKPVLILVNELSISCGDSFPALMQDEGRATIFGATTAGAGGSVGDVSEPIGYSEITFSYTISLGVRRRDVALPGGVVTRFVENVGVIPDIPYEVTAKDFFGGYAGYRTAVEQAILGMLEE